MEGKKTEQLRNRHENATHMWRWRERSVEGGGRHSLQNAGSQPTGCRHIPFCGCAIIEERRGAAADDNKGDDSQAKQSLSGLTFDLSDFIIEEKCLRWRTGAVRLQASLKLSKTPRLEFTLQLNAKRIAYIVYFNKKKTQGLLQFLKHR